MKKLTLKEHQDVLYDIIYAFDDFCKINNIRYSLAFGTLIGAVRHNGIIPWDDDIDVMMERTEYERFLSLSHNCSPAGYEVYSIEFTKGYYYPFAKFGKTSTLLHEPYKYVPKKGIGINIDVFPIDGCPGTREEATQYEVKTSKDMWNILYNRFYLKSADFIGWKSKLFYIIYIINKIPFIQKRFLRHYFDRVKKYDLETTDYCSCVCWGNNGYAMTKKQIRQLKLCRFGSRDLPIPIDYDEILRNQYGDYMSPPENKQSTHLFGDSVFIIE